jgi:dienelactone hydrolase
MPRRARTRAGRVAVLLAALGIAAAPVAGPQLARAETGLIQIRASKPFTAGSVSLAAEVIRPEGAGPFPAVVLMHGCGGWQPAVKHALRRHALYLRDHGFAVLTLDSFGPRGNAGGTVCSSFRYLREARTYRTYDAFDALRYLRTLDFVDPERIFLVGQSNGGSVALKAAARGAARKYSRGGDGFRAVVAYYPWCGALGTTRPALEAPLMIFGGGRDDWVPPGKCRRFRATGAELEVKVYPTAAHSFDLLAPEHRYMGKLVGHNQEATEDSRRRMLAFFEANFDARSGDRVATADEAAVRVAGNVVDR